MLVTKSRSVSILSDVSLQMFDFYNLLTLKPGCWHTRDCVNSMNAASRVETSSHCWLRYMDEDEDDDDDDDDESKMCNVQTTLIFQMPNDSVCCRFDMSV